MPTPKRLLIMYSTLGCHLCDLAEDVIVKSGVLDRSDVEVMDIAENDALIDSYGVRIPVVRDSKSGAEIGWPFSGEEFITWFSVLNDEHKLSGES